MGVVTAIIALIAGLNALWLGRYRAGGLMDIDESSYLATSLEYSIRSHNEGWAGIWLTFQGHAPSAPLVPFVASLLYFIFGTHFMLAFAVLIVAMVAVLICTAALAYRLGGPTAAIVATVAVAGTPVLIDYTRSFQFALPVTAFFTAATLCMAASQRLQNRRLALAWGVLVGLMLLTRTMTIAFLPGLFAAGLLVALTSPSRLRALVNLTVGTLAAALVASVWYAANWQTVIGYLLNNGYGSGSADYAKVPLSPSVLWLWVQSNVNEYVYLPLALVLLAGGLAFGELLIAEFRGRRGTIPSRLQWLAGRSRVVMAIPVLAGLAALMSSEEPGTGYVAPLLPVATVLAVVSLAKVPWVRIRVAALVLVVLAGTAGIASKSGLPAFNGGAVVANLPAYGYVTVFYSGAPIQPYEQNGGVGDGTLSPSGASADWPAADRLAAVNVTQLASQSGRPAVCAFGFTDRFFNPNTLWLESSADFKTPIQCMWMDPSSGTTADAASLWLGSGAASSANVLITADSTAPSDFGPTIDDKAVEEAAAASGFTPARQMALPNGRHLTFWVRST